MIAKRTSVNCWTVELQEDPATGDLILPLNEEMLASTGWQLGDVLVWELSTSENGPCAIITKKEIQNDDN